MGMGGFPGGMGGFGGPGGVEINLADLFGAGGGMGGMGVGGWAASRWAVWVVWEADSQVDRGGEVVLRPVSTLAEQCSSATFLHPERFFITSFSKTVRVSRP